MAAPITIRVAVIRRFQFSKQCVSVLSSIPALETIEVKRNGGSSDRWTDESADCVQALVCFFEHRAKIGGKPVRWNLLGDRF